MKKELLIALSLFLSSFVMPALAGTAVKATLESLSRKNAWVNVTAAIDHSRMRVDFEGPSASGALIYDRESSLLTLVDHLHKTVLALSPENQQAVKLLLMVFSGKLTGGADGSDPAAKRAIELAEENARSFFNGAPKLERKGVTQAGFVCDEYVTDLLGAKAREVWVTTPEKAGLNSEDYNTFRSFAHLAIDLGGPLLDQLEVDTEAFEQNLSDPQWPITEVLYAKGKASARFKVLGLSTRDFDDNFFTPPLRYRVLSLMDLLNKKSEKP